MQCDCFFVENHVFIVGKNCAYYIQIFTVKQSKVNVDLYSDCSCNNLASNALSDMTRDIQGFTQFYLPPNTSHTCLYSPAAEHHCPFARIHYAYATHGRMARLS